MKLLFSSDLHGLLPAYERFSQLLFSHDIGILAGDLRDPYISQDEITDMFGLTEDDFLEELPSPDDTAEQIIERAIREYENPSGHLMQALKIKEQELKDILKSGGKPIFLIPGNHDKTEWESGGLVQNIDRRRIDCGEYNIVGYRFSNFDRREKDQAIDLVELAKLVDKKTILVTHGPPYGVLDLTHSQEHIGSKVLNKFIRRKKPFLHLFGHVHEAFGIQERSINGCYPDINKFISIDLDLGQILFID